MNQTFGQSVAPKTTAPSTMSNNNVTNTGTPGVTSGFLNPSAQSTAKPMSNLFGPAPSATSSPTTKPPTTGTLFSWPNTSSPANTTNQFTNFKSSPSTSTTAGFSSKTTATTAQSIQPVSSATTTGGFNLGSTTSATTVNFGIQPTSKSSVATTTSTPSLQLATVQSTHASNSNQTSTATSSTAPSLNLTTTSATIANTTSLALTSKPATSSSGTQPQNLTFQQLEELILNKWTAELYEQEKVFLNQATQINIWDKIINENAEKLTQLHSTMEKVRKLQSKINDDLDVISTHQKDLEMCLVPMEKEDLLSVLKADPNRKNLYSNAKKIDSQIKSMSENLKETIEHINETSRSHDTDDPVIQVGRILNAHMESLRWIDEHTARMQDYFDSLLKVHDDLRRECDLTKHDVY